MTTAEPQISDTTALAHADQLVESALLSARSENTRRAQWRTWSERQGSDMIFSW